MNGTLTARFHSSERSCRALRQFGESLVSSSFKWDNKQDITEISKS